MKIRNSIDLGKSFERLKTGLANCDKLANKPDANLGLIYHHLAGFVEAHISHCTEEDNKEGETQDDIPEQLFRQ